MRVGAYQGVQQHGVPFRRDFGGGHRVAPKLVHMKVADNSRRRVVYVLDDDDSVRNGLSRLLRSANFEVRSYGVAEEFIEDVRNVQNACVILDLTMPRMSGVEVMAALKERGIRLPVIALSARDADAARSEARQLGALMYLSKPVDDQALLDAINWTTSETCSKAC